MKKRWKSAIALGMAFMMTLPMAACGGSASGSGDSSGTASPEETMSESGAAKVDLPYGAPEESGDPVEGGSVTMYWSEFHNEFDPSVNDNRNYVTFYCDSLWNVKSDDFSQYTSAFLDADSMEGQIAKDWEVSDDYKTLTVTIRDDVYFQDKAAAGFDDEYDVYKGRKLTAADVKYSYDRLLGLDGVDMVQMEETTWPDSLSMLESVEAPDDTTVIFHFNTDYELAVDKFITKIINICGPEWDELTDDQKADWHYASGTGPFILKDYVNDNTMTFEKNPNYWAKDADGNTLPYLDEVKLVKMSDSATELSSFIAGDIDILSSNNQIFDTDEESQLADALGDDEFYVISYVGDSPAVALKQGNNPVEALTDEKVREAMQYAIDLNAISQYLGYSYGSDVGEKQISFFRYGTPYSDISAWPDDLVASYTTYDPDKAKEMLKEEGYGDGFEFDVYIFSGMPVDAFTLASEYLAQVGVTMNVNIVSTPPDMIAHGQDPDDPACVYSSVGVGRLEGLVDGTVRSDGVTNLVLQKNDDIDALCDKFDEAETFEESVDAAKELDQTLMAQHYYLMVSYGQKWNCYYRSRVHGLDGALLTAGFWTGYMMARTWVTD